MILLSIHAPGIFNFLGLPQRLETLLHHQNATCFSSNFCGFYWSNFFGKFWWTLWTIFLGNYGNKFSIYLVVYLISLGWNYVASSNATCFSSNFGGDYWGNFFGNFWWSFRQFLVNFLDDLFWQFLGQISIYLVYLFSLGCRKDLKLCCII